MLHRIDGRRAACAALLLAACAEDQAGDQRSLSASDQMGPSDLEVAMSALENPIISCQIKAGECVQQANGISELQACQGGVGECLRGAGERVLQVAEGVGGCREEQRQCLFNGGAQSGSCLQGFAACVDALVPDDDGPLGLPGFPAPGLDGPRDDASAPSEPAVSDDGGAGAPTPPAPPSAPDDDTDAGAPDVDAPAFPGLGGDGLLGFPQLPGFPSLPGSECLDGLRTCAGNAGADLLDCAGEARECLLSASPLGLSFL